MNREGSDLRYIGFAQEYDERQKNASGSAGAGSSGRGKDRTASPGRKKRHSQKNRKRRRSQNIRKKRRSPAKAARQTQCLKRF